MVKVGWWSTTQSCPGYPASPFTCEQGYLQFPFLHATILQLMGELVAACQYLDRKHPSARVIIVTGSGSKAFAAGADIKEMSSVTYSEVGRG